MAINDYSFYGAVSPGRPAYGPAKGRRLDSGALSITENLYCVVDELMDRIPQKRTPHRKFKNLLASGSTFSEGAPISTITTTYEGLNDGDPLPKPVVSNRVLTRTVNIANHPKFEQLIQEAGGKGPGMAVFDEDDTFVTFGAQAGDLQDVDSFEDGSLLHTYTFLSRSPFTGWRKLHKIDTPIGSRPSGVDNWRLVDVQETERGYFWEISLTWAGSGIVPWHKTIYG